MRTDLGEFETYLKCTAQGIPDLLGCSHPVILNTAREEKSPHIWRLPVYGLYPDLDTEDFSVEPDLADKLN